MNKIKNKLIIVLLLLIAICACVAIFFKDQGEEEVKPSQKVVIVDEEPEYDLEALRKLWDEEHALNGDYKGRIIFDSGIIDLPFVQGSTNDDYLRIDWVSGNYDDEGTVFLDSANDLDDRNLILYGHFVYSSLDPERTHKFTPLERLLKEENYEENKELILVLEDEIREYEVVLVYYCELVADETGDYVYTREDLQYYWLNEGDGYFDHEDRSINSAYFKDYIYAAKGMAPYLIDAEYDLNDRYLTLQTCVEGHDELREIVLCKEVKVIPYQ